MTTTEEIKALREETGLSIGQIRAALEEASKLGLAGPDLTVKALEILKKKGAEIAAKKSDRNLGAGVIAAYVHSGDTVGAMLELLCETDFVAKNPEFKTTARDLAMHVAAMNPADVGELLTQPFIKGSGESIGDIINNTIQKFGERTEIGHFTRFSLN